MSNSPRNKEQDRLIQQTPSQGNPYLAKPEDFAITTAADGARLAVPGHGQCGDTSGEYGRLLAEADKDSKPPLGRQQQRAVEPGAASKPHTRI